MTPQKGPSQKAIDDMNKFLAKKWDKLTKKYIEKQAEVAQAK